MLFNSFAFLFGYLPWVLIGFWLLNRHDNARLWFLFAASVVFYGYWDWHFVPLLLGSIAFNWMAAEAYLGSRRRLIIIAAIAGNLLLLGLFKYLGFFGEIVGETTGWHSDFVKLALPLGISFFTFHHIIYLVDLLKGKAPRYRFRDYALYIALFPQILAGPLVRYSEIMPQIVLPPLRTGFAERCGRGLMFLLVGLAKKAFLADELAKIADPVFSAAARSAIDSGQAWTAALAFPLQIYFDFSGYSDMAIGVAFMLGFTLPFNFDAPYRATSLTLFWRRWHMTLMRFLRDYVYIPLGGNRRGIMRQCLNLLLTFLLGGLWHGAGWTFIVWGALHGTSLAAGALWRRYLRPVPVIVSWPLLIGFLILTWVFFRAPSLPAAKTILAAMAGQNGYGPVLNFPLIALAAAIALIGPSSQKFIESMRPRLWLSPVAAAATLAILLKINGSPAYEFIYFHF